MNTILPIEWDLEYKEYEKICKKLGLTPNLDYFKALQNYLSQECNEKITKFSRYLSLISKTSFNLQFLDLFTRIFISNHPLRYQLNAIIALHECDYLDSKKINLIYRGKVKMFFNIFSTSIKLLLVLLIMPFWLIFMYFNYFIKFGINFKLFKGKTILLTGVSSGIGLSIFKMLVSKDINIIIITRKKDERFAKFNNVRNIVADLSKDSELIHSLNQNNINPNEIDYSILSAGVKYKDSSNFYKNLVDTMQVNFLTNAQYCDWIKHTNSHTLVISSIGRYHGMHNNNGYNSSKSALSIFIESLILDQQKEQNLATFGVVEPGIVLTEMTKTNFFSYLFGVTKQNAANKIIKSLIKKDKNLIFPLFFRILTFLVSSSNLELRLKILKYLK